MNINIEDCYNKYAPMVFRRCMTMLKNEDDALDAAQDVFVNLLRYSKRLHGKFLSSLLYTIATNTCLNRIRRRKLQGNDHGDPYDSESAVLDWEFENVENGMMMDVVLQNETESTRSILFMYHGDGMTLKEISQLTGLSVSGVRKRIMNFNARAKLKLEGEQL